MRATCRCRASLPDMSLEIIVARAFSTQGCDRDAWRFAEKSFIDAQGRVSTNFEYESFINAQGRVGTNFVLNSTNAPDRGRPSVNISYVTSHRMRPASWSFGLLPESDLQVPRVSAGPEPRNSRGQGLWYARM